MSLLGRLGWFYAILLIIVVPMAAQPKGATKNHCESFTFWVAHCAQPQSNPHTRVNVKIFPSYLGSKVIPQAEAATLIPSTYGPGIAQVRNRLAHNTRAYSGATLRLAALLRSWLYFLLVGVQAHWKILGKSADRHSKQFSLCLQIKRVKVLSPKQTSRNCLISISFEQESRASSQFAQHWRHAD